MSVNLGCHIIYHRLGALNLFPHSFGGWEVKIKMLADLVLGKAFFLACRRSPSHCVLIRDTARRWPSLVSLFIRILILLDQDLTVMTSFNLNYFLYKEPCFHVQSHWGLERQHMNFFFAGGNTQFTPQQNLSRVSLSSGHLANTSVF